MTYELTKIKNVVTASTKVNFLKYVMSEKEEKIYIFLMFFDLKITFNVVVDCICNISGSNS